MVQSDSWLKYIKSSIDFSTCGMIISGGTLSYIRGEVSSEPIEKCLKDGPLAKQVLDQLLFARAVDNFQTYMSDLIFEILQKYPNAMFGKKVDARILFEGNDLESVRQRAVQKFVMDLGYKSADDLAKFVEDQFGLTKISGKLTRKRMNRLIQIRNIIAHNRGIVNDIYIFKSGSRSDRIGKEVKLPSPIKTNSYFRGLVQALDDEAVPKFKL